MFCAGLEAELLPLPAEWVDNCQSTLSGATKSYIPGGSLSGTVIFSELTVRRFYDICAFKLPDSTQLEFCSGVHQAQINHGSILTFPNAVVYIPYLPIVVRRTQRPLHSISYVLLWTPRPSVGLEAD